MKPDLRFPEFKDEWETNKLGLYTNVIMGQSPSSKNYTNDSNNIVLVQGNADLQKGKIYPRIYTTEITKIAEMNDIILTVRAPVGELAISQMKVCIGRGVCAIKGNTFIYSYLNYLNDKNYWKRIVQGSTFESISGTDVKNVSLKIPSKKEQEKIGRFFSKLDRQIELEEQKLAKLEEQKKGYMQKIFSKELRFKDENGNNYPEWEDKKLLNVIGIQNGYAFKSNLFSEKGMPIIRITDINKSTVKKGTVYYPESIEINERFKIKQYDILIAMSGATTGKVGKYISEKPSLLNQRIGKFVMKKGTDNNFMFTYLNSLYFKKELSKLLVAGAQPNISSQDIENINLFIPINEEQRKIGEFFNELDGLIEKQSSKIGVLKQRKKGFLQKMFV